MTTVEIPHPTRPTRRTPEIRRHLKSLAFAAATALAAAGLLIARDRDQGETTISNQPNLPNPTPETTRSNENLIPPPPKISAVPFATEIPTPTKTPIPTATSTEVSPLTTATTTVEATKAPEKGFRKTYDKVTVVTSPDLGSMGISKIELNTEKYPDASERLNAAVMEGFARALGISREQLKQQIANGQHPKITIYGFGPDDPNPHEIKVDTSQGVTIVVTKQGGWVKPSQGQGIKYIVDYQGALTIETMSSGLALNYPASVQGSVEGPLLYLACYDCTLGGVNNFTSAQIARIKNPNMDELLYPGLVFPIKPEDALFRFN